MALTHLAFTLLMLAFFEDSEANKSVANVKPILDPKRRSEAVDEAFLEQKDILLDMLELKLKEVRDKKKKKAELGETKTNREGIIGDGSRNDKCESMLRNVDVKVNVNGISAVGDANVKLKYGTSGKGFVNINATGISNVGQANVELGVGESAVYIPGLSNLFIERHLMDCAKRSAPESQPAAPSTHVEHPHPTPHVQQPHPNAHINQPPPNSHAHQPPPKTHLHQPPLNPPHVQQPSAPHVQQPSAPNAHIQKPTQNQHPPQDQQEIRFDQTRRKADNDTKAEVEADNTNASLTPANTVELTTATVFEYTSPTTSTPVPTVVYTSTPYFVRAATDQPPTLQSVPTNGIINAV